MKFTLQTDILKNITNTLARVVAKEVPGSSSGGILVQVSSQKVSFKTQQFDFNIIYTVDVDEVRDGTAFIPIHALDGVVGSLVDTMTTIELEEKKILVRTNTSTSEIYILSGDDVVVEGDKPDGKPSFVIKREVLVQGFKNVQHAASESAIKPEIASVYLHTKNDSVYFVSTDAFRLAEARFLLEETQSDDISVIIPIKSVLKILRVLEGIASPDVSLYVYDGTITVVTENVLIKMNSVKGSFPDYRNIIPGNFDLEITVLRSDFLNFLKKARLFSDKLNKLSFDIKDASSILLGFDNETVGSTRNIVPATMRGKVDTLPSFNYRFVSDALSVISDDRIVFSVVNDATKPLMIRGADDTTLTTIISPLLEK